MMASSLSAVTMLGSCRMRVWLTLFSRLKMRGICPSAKMPPTRPVGAAPPLFTKLGMRFVKKVSPSVSAKSSGRRS